MITTPTSIIPMTDQRITRRLSPLSYLYSPEIPHDAALHINAGSLIGSYTLSSHGIGLGMDCTRRLR